MRAKHLRSRIRRRVRQGRWDPADVVDYLDHRLLVKNRRLRQSMRQAQNRRQDPFMLLQHKYPWPRPFGDNFGAHSDMIKRREANLKKIHTMYRKR